MVVTIVTISIQRTKTLTRKILNGYTNAVVLGNNVSGTVTTIVSMVSKVGGNQSAAQVHGRMGRGGHGIPKVSPGPAMPDPSMPCGQATPQLGLAIARFKTWS
jgi:hypothetical protein